MPTLDSQTNSDLRADLAIGSDTGDPSTTVFTDAELQRLYDRAEGDYYTTVVLVLRQLLADANKLVRYKYGANFEDAAQVRAHIKDTLDYYETKVSQEIKFVSLEANPPYKRDEPNTGTIGIEPGSEFS